MHVGASRGGHDGHGEGGVDIFQVAPHWRLTAIMTSIMPWLEYVVSVYFICPCASFQIGIRISVLKELSTYNLVLKECRKFSTLAAILILSRSIL